MIPPIFVQTCAGREGYATALAAQLPSATFIKDDHREGAAATWLRLLAAVPDTGALILEDDIILCDDFEARAAAIITEHGASLVSFFSRDILQAGYYRGWRFAFHLANWFPRGMAAELIVYAPTWKRRPAYVEPARANPDFITCDYLKATKQKFYQAVPSLVDHIVGPSAIGHRAWKRTSPTFQQATDAVD